MMYSISDNTILREFLSVSHWESLVAILVFYAIMIPFFILVSKYKLKFMYRVLIGLGIGLVFGIVIQAIIGFPPALTDASGNKLAKYDWVNQFNIWAQLFKQVFINGILLLTVPVVFVAILRVTSKSGSQNMGRITAKTIFLLLIGVVFSFTVTFWIGMATNVGGGMNMTPEGSDTNAAHASKAIPEIIWGYITQNFIATLSGTAIIPVIVVAAIIGRAIKFVQRKHPDHMQKLAIAFDRAWDIMMSMLMTFMKIMPMAVMAMITTAVTSRPIGALANIGKVIGVGYLGIICVFIYFTVVTLLSGIKTGQWWKFAWRPLLQGFATQSSNATLPMSMDTMRDEMKINESVVSVAGPLSTSMGLIACAGVQSGLITSFLWTASPEVQSGFSGGLVVYFIMSLVICLIASLGIAGIPGTASVVTSGVLGGLGYSAYFQSVYSIIGALDGIFDMGRTGANVLGGIFAGTLAAKWEGQIDEGSPLLNEGQIRGQMFIRDYVEARSKIKSENDAYFNQGLKTKHILRKNLAEAKKADGANDKVLALQTEYDKNALALKKSHFENVSSIHIEIAKLKATARATELEARKKPSEAVWTKFNAYQASEEAKLKAKLQKNNL